LWEVANVLPSSAEKTFVITSSETTFSHRDAACRAFSDECQKKRPFTALFTVSEYPEESFFVRVTFGALIEGALQEKPTIMVVGLTKESARGARDVLQKACARSFPVGKMIAGVAATAVVAGCCVIVGRRAVAPPAPQVFEPLEARLPSELSREFAQRRLAAPLIFSTFTSFLSALEAQLIASSAVPKILILSSAALREDLSKVGSTVDGEYSVLERNACVLRDNRVLIIQLVDAVDDKDFFDRSTRPEVKAAYLRLFSDPDWRATYDPRQVLLFVRPNLAYVQGGYPGGNQVFGLPGGALLLQYAIYLSVHPSLCGAWSRNAAHVGIRAEDLFVNQLARFAADVACAGANAELFAPCNLVQPGRGRGRTASLSNLVARPRVRGVSF
jgi:hypothetical protein